MIQHIFYCFHKTITTGGCSNQNPSRSAFKYSVRKSTSTYSS
jgi:hypothetical protein